VKYLYIPIDLQKPQKDSFPDEQPKIMMKRNKNII